MREFLSKFDWLTLLVGFAFYVVTLLVINSFI